MSVEEGDNRPAKAAGRQRPWWVLPGFAGIGIGALIGSLIAPMPPPSSPLSRPSADVNAATAATTLRPATTRTPLPTLRETPIPEPTARIFPPALKPARIFVFEARVRADPLPPGVWTLTPLSRYVLYEDGTFALQYAFGDPPLEDYGTYVVAADGSIFFDQWSGWSWAGPWFAYGVFQGSSLTVRYNLPMQLSEYEDAVYVGR